MHFQTELADEAATVAIGKALGTCLPAACVIFLQGTLGAGKTTFCRGVLSCFGHSSAVKSPTYTLVEPYILEERSFYHFDLYRLGHPEELEFIGIRDYFSAAAVCLIEWPDKGRGMLPEPDLIVTLESVPTGRKVVIEAKSASGEKILQALPKKCEEKDPVK